MAEITDILTQHLNTIKTRVAERMVAEKRNASGRTVSSLSVEVNGDHGTLWGSKVFLVMEKGRGPGAVPKGFQEIIYEWAKSKGISAKAKAIAGQPQSPEGALRSFAGAVAYNIMKKGTRLYRNKQYYDIFSTVLNEELEKMSEELAINLLDKVSGINESAQ